MILRRIEGGRFSEVLPLWNGDTAIIIGGGPSLTLDQVDIAQRANESGVRCIAVNAAYLVAPWADVLFFADSHFWRWQVEGAAYPTLGMSASDVRNRFSEFSGQKCTIQNSGANVTDDEVHMLRNKTHPDHGYGLSANPRELVTGRNSGFQSLNLAVLAGVKRAILLGFDGAPQQGRTHFHGGHPRPTPDGAYPCYRKAMEAAKTALQKAGVEVLNASPGSAIASFPACSLEEALA